MDVKKISALCAVVVLIVWLLLGRGPQEDRRGGESAVSPIAETGPAAEEMAAVNEANNDPVEEGVPTPAKATLEPEGEASSRVLETDFLNKYKNADITAMAAQKGLREFPDDFGGTLFVVHESGVIAANDNKEIQFRRWFDTGPGHTMGAGSCLSIQLPDGKVVVGSRDDRSLLVRAGPLAHSFLLSIAEKYYFLIYSDVQLWEELRDNPRMTGVLIYYVRGEDGKIRPAGAWSRWISADAPMLLSGMDFCLNSFSEFDLRE